MNLETLFNISNFGSEEQKVKCQRCKHMRLYQDFIDNDRVLKLCNVCREYNRNYLRNLSYNNIICPRCRRDKEIQDFINGDKRLKLCDKCREYGKKYQKL